MRFYSLGLLYNVYIRLFWNVFISLENEIKIDVYANDRFEINKIN